MAIVQLQRGGWLWVAEDEREPIAGRVYAEPHRQSGKRDIVEFLGAAVERSGGRLLSITRHTRAPWHVSAVSGEGLRLAAMVYAFRCTTRPIRGREPDERRIQLRYGGEDRWGEQPVGFDPSRSEPTVMVGVDLDAEVLVAIDPVLYDPLPSGISIEYKAAAIEAAAEAGWHVWERETRPGRRRDPRREGVETLVALRPDRFLDWISFEAEAQSLGLEHGLRFRAAERAGQRPTSLHHELEADFELSAAEILDVIASARRLGVAVRGGVAERHLERVLAADPHVRTVSPIDVDGEPDFEVALLDGRVERVECKVISPTPYADGTPKVEVQKTRGSKGDPASRFYAPSQFHVIAACVWPVSGRWEFRFRRTSGLPLHPDHPGRLAVMHRVDDGWSSAYPAE